MTTPAAWYGCPDPDRCEDPECSNPAHMPDPDGDTIWTFDDDAAWLWDDDVQRRRADR
jgi:hypothetical protein